MKVHSQTTRNVLIRVLSTQYGFICASDMGALLADPATRTMRVLLRFHERRIALPLDDAAVAIERDRQREHPSLRDVGLIAEDAHRLAAELGCTIGSGSVSSDFLPV